MPNPGDGIRLRSSALTSVGQVRENNEDSVHLWSGDQYVLAVVADGMGGAAAGEEASQLTVKAIQEGMALRSAGGQEMLSRMDTSTISKKMRSAIEQANLSIMHRAQEKPDMRGMGTTATLAFVRGFQVSVAHVGDSRAYHIVASTGEIKQITADHSFVEALLAAGHITPEQADEHPMRNVLYRALGQTEDLDIDLYHTLMAVGDRLVLCSDGLTRHVQSFEIAQVALANNNPQPASQKLIDLANERGGEDNVSVIVIALEQDADNPTQKAVTIEIDGDETLRLADLPDLPPLDESEADPPIDTAPHLSKQKMQAERVSDSLATQSAENALPDTANRQPGEPLSDRLSLAPSHVDHDGEGHDTRSPEQ